ncbi:nucleotidyltransferase family protein [Photobacterium sp. OFAV2-7]|uniref:nucleotidyltransferase family protein n=1 Tax=Photobacterium sp. OFAV2-7 TaxID=2917748 RepID=UPI001EF6FA93|nr:nucleotidyltransferase family protein [Photobacterium sp. OFAV2-7]MCG7586266.1 nucleotidyltransferase family protein [Photobacterium sp. OFAV2-7]
MKKITAVKLVDILRSPALLLSMNPRKLSQIVAEARFYNMLAQLKWLCDEADIWFDLPVEFQRHVLSAQYSYTNQIRLLEQEHTHISALFGQLGVRWVYLKGAAYQLSGLACLQGRIMSDIDILVPQSQIEAAEKMLMAHGWLHKKMTDYDDKFYRDYSQEIPPLRHFERQTELDVHFNILPSVLRHGPDPAALHSHTLALPDNSGARVLSPEAMVLHSAIHLFYESEFHKGVRDLFDIFQLIECFSLQPDFWNKLIQLQRSIGNGECMYFALRYCRLYFRLEIPNEVVSFYEQFKPSQLVFRLLDPAFTKVFSSVFPAHHEFGDHWLLFVLYLRGHLKRLPISKLVPHLIRKGLYRLNPMKKDESELMI